MSKPEFASARLSMGQLNALVKVVGGHEAVLRLLSGELMVVDAAGKFEERRDHFSLSVKTLGFTAFQLIERLHRRGIILSDNALTLLRTRQYKPLKPGIKIDMVIIKGTEFKGESCTTEDVSSLGSDRRLSLAHPEMICLVLEMLCRRDFERMRLSWIAAILPHAKKDEHFFTIEPEGDFDRLLKAVEGNSLPDLKASEGGFLFFLSAEEALRESL